ncbi:MAG: LbtU family siderophore porin [Pseudomonadota bacterium]
MQAYLKRLIISLFLSVMIITPVLADPAADPNARVQNLEQQISQMQMELDVLKKEVNPPHKKHTRHNSNSVQMSPNLLAQTPAPEGTLPASTTATTTQSVVPTFTNAYIGNPQSFPIDLDVPGRSFVSTGPYIGVPLLYSGGNLIINSPSVNEDVTLLNMRKAIRMRLNALGRPHEDGHSHLLLSGIIEGQVSYTDPGNGPTNSDITLSTAELDGYLLGPSDWLSGLFAFAYDERSGPSEGSLNNNARVLNSRVFLSKAFITVGNFIESPIYGTIGQLYVPFGTYSSNMISSPLTQILGRTKARAIVLGFQQRGDNALYAAGYIFKSDTYTGSTNRVNNGGFNIGYRFAAIGMNGDVGGGVIANIADSLHMQDNGFSSPYFGGFGSVGNGNEQIAHRVPAMNVRGMVALGSSIDLLGEYIGAINSFSENDLTFNSHGAKPKAINLEGAYTFEAFGRPTSIALGYGKSWDGLALNLAMQRFSVEFNTSWWKDTLQSLEFRHDQNYAESSYSTGTSTNPTVPLFGTGKPDNMVTAQFDMYF